ncbi:MAG: PQQ-dependent sugar dehydrogenase, partial [Pseudomonadota bacterium]|nr:PQQ-dependent sugar dehydrogenase [Pseudomonadota bacterium]
MKRTWTWKRQLLAALIAILVGAVLGSLVQTQINLAALTGLGVTITPGQRLAALGHDLLSFAPIYGGLFAAIFLPALAITGGVLRVLRWPCPGAWYALGAAVGLWAGLALVNAFAPMPTLIAATREAPGLLAMMATAGLAGWVFASLSRAPGEAVPANTGNTVPALAGVLVLAASGAMPDVARAQAAQSESA